jgi:hypothetical protein
MIMLGEDGARLNENVKLHANHGIHQRLARGLRNQNQIAQFINYARHSVSVEVATRECFTGPILRLLAHIKNPLRNPPKPR